MYGAPPSTGCCSKSAGCSPCLSRRGFLGAAAAPVLSAGVPVSGGARPLKVQPVFIYQPATPGRARSWRWSAQIYDPRLVSEEQERIRQDVDAMRREAAFPVEFLPLAAVSAVPEAARVAEGEFDVALLFASSRQPDVMAALVRPGRWTLVFVRRSSGPMYYMYIGVHGHFLRRQGDAIEQPGVGIEDVVVDSREDVLWRLRALSGLKGAVGTGIVAIGSAGGWGRDGAVAPARALARWRYDVRKVPYPELERRLRSAPAAQREAARRECARYLEDKSLKPETAPEFVERSFLLVGVFRELLREADCNAITINGCMQTVMPVAETTACLPLSVLNDEGVLAFCESDFVSIPAGILLAKIARRPVFLGNGSFPYGGLVTMSHCTAPRRMDMKEREPARLLTHYESDYGAAPKVEMRRGQTLTVVDPDFAGRRWLGFCGQIAGTPFHPICRTQIDIGLSGDTTARLAAELRGWHWLAAYGDWTREMGYAVAKAGLDWLKV